MITLEQKHMVRSWLERTVETMPVEIEKTIEEIGGEDMLLQRIDVLFWVYYSREEVQMYQEVIRLLDGEADIDKSLISAAIQRKKCHYKSTLEEITALKRTIHEKEVQLKQDEELLPQLGSTIKVLEESLTEY